MHVYYSNIVMAQSYISGALAIWGGGAYFTGADTLALVVGSTFTYVCCRHGAGVSSASTPAAC